MPRMARISFIMPLISAAADSFAWAIAADIIAVIAAMSKAGTSAACGARRLA